MRRATALATLVVVSLGLSPGAALAGTIFSVPLPELVGVIDFLPSQGFRDASFDFGVQFSDIESISIEMEAHVTAFEWDSCGDFSGPHPCVHVISLTGFVVQLDKEGFSFPVLTSSAAPFADLDTNGSEVSGVDIAAFNDPPLGQGWPYLFDGDGSVRLWWNQVYFQQGDIILNLSQPSGEIFDARLIIEGTEVPEPSTALLLGMGLLVLLAGIRRRRK